MREAPGSQQPVWNKCYSAWSEVLGADSGELLNSSFTPVCNPTWWFTSQLLVTSLTSRAHSVHMIKKGKVVGRGAVLCHHDILHHLTLRLTLAKKVIGSWWHELSQLHTPKCTTSFSRLPWRTCRVFTVLVRQSMVIPHLFGNCRA